MGRGDALRLWLFLSRLADNGIGAEGAGRLAEPLGKLTALQKLDLSCTVWAALFLGTESDVAWDGATHCACGCFSVALQGIKSALKGQGGW